MTLPTHIGLSNMEAALHMADQVILPDHCPLESICHEYFTLHQVLQNMGIHTQIAECSVSSKIKGASHDHHVSVFYLLVDGEQLSFMERGDMRAPAVIGKERLLPSIIERHSHLLGPNPTIESVKWRVDTYIYTDCEEDMETLNTRQNRSEVARLGAIALDLCTQTASGVYQGARL